MWNRGVSYSLPVLPGAKDGHVRSEEDCIKHHSTHYNPPHALVFYSKSTSSKERFFHDSG